MRKKRIIGIVAIVAIFSITALVVRGIKIKFQHEKGDISIGTEMDDTLEIINTEDIIEQIKTSEEEYIEWAENVAEEDMAQAEIGTIYDVNDIENIAYGGVVYTILDVGYIPERNMVSEVVPDYTDSRMLMSIYGDEFLLDSRIEQIGEHILWYVEYEVTNNGNRKLEAYVDDLNIVLTTPEEKIVGESYEPFYIDGNLNETSAYSIKLEPGETKRIVLGLYIDYEQISARFEDEWTKSDVFNFYIRLSPLVGGWGEEVIKYIGDDKNHIYIKCGSGSMESLSLEYEEVE